MIQRSGKTKSTYLNREMEWKSYGTQGVCFIVFPSQDGRYYDFENMGMVESVQYYLETQQIQLFCVDSNDQNSFSALDKSVEERILAQENYYHYIVDEFIPFLKTILPSSTPIYTTGCSMGGYHALNFFLRRPDLFDGCIGLSGAYDLRLFFDYFTPLVYDNSPVDYIEGMPYEHPYVKMYQSRAIILCCGRGSYEDIMQKDLGRMQELFAYKNVPCWIDFWGEDVIHDWSWWKKQLPYFMNYLLERKKQEK